MLLEILLLFPCWNLCTSPFSASIRYNATKQRVTLEVSCQDKAIINILKMVQYNLPHGIQQDVTVVSNNINLAVDFQTSHKSLDLIEVYKSEIIKQMLENVSNHGYKYNLFKKQPYFMLVGPKNIKECLKRMCLNDKATETTDPDKEK